MRKQKVKEEKVEGQSEVSRAQHSCLNNLNMLMFYIRKKNLSDEYLNAIAASSKEMLNEIKAL